MLPSQTAPTSRITRSQINDFYEHIHKITVVYTGKQYWTCVSFEMTFNDFAKTLPPCHWQGCLRKDAWSTCFTTKPLGHCTYGVRIQVPNVVDAPRVRVVQQKNDWNIKLCSDTGNEGMKTIELGPRWLFDLKPLAVPPAARFPILEYGLPSHYYTASARLTIPI